MLKPIAAAAAESGPRSLQEHFRPFRENTVGTGHMLTTPYGRKRLLYADWTASGRLYEPIERRLVREFGPLIGNPHTEASATGQAMTQAYQEAKAIVKRHAGASADDCLLFCGNGMTGAVNKLVRLLGLGRGSTAMMRYRRADEDAVPVVFTTHMEHHSNLLPWLESGADIVTLPAGRGGAPDPAELTRLLKTYRHRRLKIGAFTACSNVTGIRTPYRRLAAAMHLHGGVCFVDFAANAPYDRINMHPPDPDERLDAVFFSPHKFLGGPGTPGVLLFHSSLHKGGVPDEPGGGTVQWVDPWGGRHYLPDIERREEGGTPGFLQAIRAALAVRLKEAMGAEQIAEREAALSRRLQDGLAAVPGLYMLEGQVRERLGIISFILEGLHYNLAVRLLNDRFGIQARGGCSCAGPYGHSLLDIGPHASCQVAGELYAGDQSHRPGWVRLSVHPIMTEAEIDFIIAAVAEVAARGPEWKADYVYDSSANAWRHKSGGPDPEAVQRLFEGLHRP